MTIRENFRRTTRVGIVLAGLVAAATTALAGTASAMPTERSQCNASDVNVWLSAESAGEGSRHYVITLEAKPGVSCYVSGSPTLIDFLTASGDVAPVVSSTFTPIPTPRVLVDAHHSAQIDIGTRDEAGIPVKSLRFSIPSDGQDTVVTIPWTPGSIAKQADFKAVKSAPAGVPTHGSSLQFRRA